MKDKARDITRKHIERYRTGERGIGDTVFAAVSEALEAVSDDEIIALLNASGDVIEGSAADIIKSQRAELEKLKRSDMQHIISNADLIPGRHYWCRDKLYGVVSLQECRQESHPNEEWKYLGGRIWAMDNNNQALRRWDIVGPLPQPAINFDDYVNHPESK